MACGHRHDMQTINMTTDTDDGGGAAGDLAGRRRFSERLLCIFLRYRGPAGLRAAMSMPRAVASCIGDHAASALVDATTGSPCCARSVPAATRRDSRRRPRRRGPRPSSPALREGSRRNGSVVPGLPCPARRRHRAAAASGGVVRATASDTSRSCREWCGGRWGSTSSWRSSTSATARLRRDRGGACGSGALGALEGQKVLAAALPLIDEAGRKAGRPRCRD